VTPPAGRHRRAYGMVPEPSHIPSEGPSGIDTFRMDPAPAPGGPYRARIEGLFPFYGARSVACGCAPLSASAGR
jgi:hypothetical protein